MSLHDSQVTNAWYQAISIFSAMKDWFIQVDLLSLDLRSKVFSLMFHLQFSLHFSHIS